MRRLYIVKRADVDDKNVYVFTSKSAMRDFIKKTLKEVGGVWMELVVTFNNENEEREFFKKCAEYSNIIIVH